MDNLEVLCFVDYASASKAAAEAGPLVAATLEHATSGVLIAFAEVLDEELLVLTAKLIGESATANCAAVWAEYAF